MKVYCMMCGKPYELTPVDKDYKKAEEGKKVVYICEQCNQKATYENREQRAK